eukprot:scaffold1960_cov242-Pinguiococcus_pyrenoidosus.AAC.2
MLECQFTPRLGSRPQLQALHTEPQGPLIGTDSESVSGRITELSRMIGRATKMAFRWSGEPWERRHTRKCVEPREPMWKMRKGIRGVAEPTNARPPHAAWQVSAERSANCCSVAASHAPAKKKRKRCGDETRG